MVFIPENGFEEFRLRRSVLFMPASNDRAIGKIPDLACDGVILDLEDALAEKDRQKAHARLRSGFTRQMIGARELIVRVTCDDSPSFESDLEAALAARPDAILLPKAEHPEKIARIGERVTTTNDSIRLWLMIETPAAIMKLDAICGASPALAALVVGPNDLARTTGVSLNDDRKAMLPWLMMILAAGRAHGLAVLDGVYNRFRDELGLEQECHAANAMGFDGKTLIHPSQIAVANRIFSPSAEALQRAAEIVAAFDNSANRDAEVMNIEGEMVERLHYRMAQTLLSTFKERENDDDLSSVDRQ